MSDKYIDIVFDGSLNPDEGANFVEVENEKGQSINFGEWVFNEDKYLRLRIRSRDLDIQQPTWISVEDGLPKWNGKIGQKRPIVIKAFLWSVHLGLVRGGYDDGQECFVGGLGMKLNDVTHWMYPCIGAPNANKDINSDNT